MKLENQVSSLELSKRLKSLGVKQESLFYWQTNDMERKDECYEIALGANWGGFYYPKEFSAFTVAELGEMLPQLLKIEDKNYQLFCSVSLDKQWFVVYSNERDYHDNAPIRFMMCHNEADARAKMLVYLLENNLITNN